MKKNLSITQPDSNAAEHSNLEQLAEPLANALQPLENVPERRSEASTAGKEIFLAQARRMKPAVSSGGKERHTVKPARKERTVMHTFARIVLALAIAIGGASATAVAAQASTPNDMLYPVKTFTEDVRLALTTSPDAEFNYLLDLVDRRMGEMEALANAGETIPNEVAERLHVHLQQALQQAAQMDDPTMLQAMNQVQTMLQQQLQTMEQIHERTQTNVNTDALHLAEEAINRVHAAAEGAIQNPTEFRNQQEVNQPGQAGDQTYPGNGQGGPGESGNGPGAETCEGEDCPELLEGQQQGGHYGRWGR